MVTFISALKEKKKTSPIFHDSSCRSPGTESHCLKLADMPLPEPASLALIGQSALCAPLWI